MPKPAERESSYLPPRSRKVIKGVPAGLIVNKEAGGQQESHVAVRGRPSRLGNQIKDVSFRKAYWLSNRGDYGDVNRIGCLS